MSPSLTEALQAVLVCHGVRWDMRQDRHATRVPQGRQIPLAGSIMLRGAACKP